MAVDVEIGKARAVRSGGTTRPLAPTRSGCRLASGHVDLPSPFSSAIASSSTVTRQPAFLSCARSASKPARFSFFSAASRSSASGANGAPGSVAVPSNQSIERITNVLGRINGVGDQVFGFEGMVRAHQAFSPMEGARALSRSLKSIPCGGRAMRTRRPSTSSAERSLEPPPRRGRRHRRARSRRGRRLVDRGHEGPRSIARPMPHRPVACMAVEHVSMPS